MSNNTINTTIGYVLLIAGILLIIVPIYQAYTMYFNGANIPEILKEKPLEQKQNVSPSDFQGQMQNAMLSIFPIEMLYKAIDLIIWMILMLVIIIAGKQLASIGIRLLKKEG